MGELGRLQIRLARKSDLKAYTELFQKTYQKAYVNNKLGLTKERFSKKIFSSEGWQDYLNGLLKPNAAQRTWLAFNGTRLIGAVTMTKVGRERELRGFYVAPDMQGKGIGKTLYRKALGFGTGSVFLEVYSHAHKTIAMYKKWGFRRDAKRGVVHSHWSEWPKGLTATRIFLKLKGP